MNPIDNTAKQIVEAALRHGYEQCGIIKTGEMLDYADRLRERIERTPENKDAYAPFFRFANPGEHYPWAKSIVICARGFGKYRIPEQMEGKIAKYYLVDGRKDEKSPDYQASVAFEEYLLSLGLKAETERKFGLTALRWAAYKAGIGLIRRNNFFYTESGSWVHLEAWLIDREIELKQKNMLKPCPENCGRCINACPTKSLSRPYTMSRATCISCLNTWDGDDLSAEPNNKQMGQWIYGCDACQDICPFNTNKWDAAEEFPGLAELAEKITLENIVMMDYDTMGRTVLSKFFYIGPDRLWKWKVNALNAMMNKYKDDYRQAILNACFDENINVCKMALWVRDTLKLT